ncbi:MAG: DUF2393 family protein [Helicobacteraceae bacterium]
MAFGLVLAVFFIFLILYVAFKAKKILSFVFLSLSLFSIVVGPFFAYNFVSSKFESVSYDALRLKQLYFTNSAVLTGELTNTSGKKIADCKLSGKAFGATNSVFKQFFGLIRARSRAEVFIDGIIAPGKTHEFELTFRGIKFDDNVSIFLKTRCR